MTSVDGPATPPPGAPEAPPAASPVGAVPPPGWSADGTPPPGWPVDGTPHPGWPAGAPPVYPTPEPDRLTRFVVRLYDRSPRWAVPLAAVGCVAAGIGYALISDPTRSDPDAAPTCLLKLTTGLDCPGCGGTRALWYVLHGDLPAAARHHFLFVFVLPFLAYLFVAWAGRQAFGWRLPELRISSKVIGGFLAVWLAFSVLRNLPWAPFTSLYV
ncbi:DUF2752 domain-containing protein [Micromonospora krabiensis]|uniref:DUF2752 domain-containing protein n=1 Tax=Micromonospora krabiensis TaxID=307121 RepID=UPI000B847F6D|nr:DUF2752 domain-containing protein [Micromonospora krabiensis]